jgi:uncharacterized protein YukE
MKKLILRLLGVILAVYLAGSIYPLCAHEAGHSHGPAPSAPPAPAPPPVPPGPVQVDTKTGLPTPQAGEPSGLSAPAGGCSGCGGGGYQPPMSDAERQKIQDQINQLEAQAATYNKYADQYDKTADELQARVKRGLTEADDNWLESHTAATVTGYRGSAYQSAPDSIKKEMDDFEKLHPARDASQSGFLAFATMFGGGKKGLRKGKFMVEITRTRAFAKQLRQKAQECQQKINELKSQLR